MLNIPQYPITKTQNTQISSLSAMFSTNKQLPNKGKEKVSEELSEANSNMMKEMVNEGPALESKNKGKEILIVEEPNSNRDKRKAIVIEEPDDHDSKNHKTDAENGGEDSTNSTDEIIPQRLFGFIINNNPNKRKRKSVYSCGFCVKTFDTPQALGGHQNGHKWERALKQGMQAMNVARGMNSMHEFSPPILPSYEPFNGNQRVTLNPINQHLQGQVYHTPTPYPMMGYGYQYCGQDRMFLHPEGAWFNPGFGTQEFGNSRTFLQQPLIAGFNPNLVGNSSGMLNIGYGAFQHPELGLFNPGFVTNEVKETQQGGKSGFDFVLQPTRKVTSSEIDFDVLPKRGDVDTKTHHDEAATKFDLTLKL